MNIYAMTDRIGGPFSIYHCYDESGKLLYVGRSKNVTERMEWHKRQSDWFGQCVSIGVLYCDTIDEAKALEDKSILELRPAFNKGTTAEGAWCHKKLGPKLPKRKAREIELMQKSKLEVLRDIEKHCDARIEKLTDILLERKNEIGAGGHHYMVILASKIQESRNMLRVVQEIIDHLPSKDPGSVQITRNDGDAQ